MASAHYSSDEEVKPSDSKPKLRQKHTILDYFKRKPKQDNKMQEDKQDKKKTSENKVLEKPVEKGESDQQTGVYRFNIKYTDSFEIFKKCFCHYDVGRVEKIVHLLF